MSTVNSLPYKVQKKDFSQRKSLCSYGDASNHLLLFIDFQITFRIVQIEKKKLPGFSPQTSHTKPTELYFGNVGYIKHDRTSDSLWQMRNNHAREYKWKTATRIP
jgi:hypothetical protein